MPRSRSLSGTGTLKTGRLSGPVQFELSILECHGFCECRGSIKGDLCLVESAYSASIAKIVRDDTGNEFSIVLIGHSHDGRAEIDLR